MNAPRWWRSLGKQAQAQVVFCTWSAVAVLGVIIGANAFLSLTVIPDGPHANRELFKAWEPYLQEPVQGPTTTPRPHVKVNKDRLLMPQNPSCWIGLPGWTCTLGTTYYPWPLPPGMTKEASK